MARKNIQYEYDGKEYSCHEERREWNGGPIEGKIYQIGIQAPPGVKFFLNGNNIITIGPVGLFSFDFEKVNNIIYSIGFDNKQMEEKVKEIFSPLLIDLVMEEG